MPPDDQQATHPCCPHDAWIGANEDGINDNKEDAAENSRAPPPAKDALKHTHHDGADDNHIEAADGDDMYRADSIEVLRQLRRDAAFIAQQDAG